MRIRRRVLLAASVVAALAAACSDDESGERTATRSLALTLTGLSPLGSQAVYEGWLIVGGSPVTTGRFQVEAGRSAYSFDVDAEMADAATTFVLTIEPAEGDDPAPADTHVLAGNISGGAATLTASHPAAIGSDLSAVSGRYILETPTTASEAADYAQGIWYLDPSGPSATLVLPALPSGWLYEGWVVGPDGPVSTGTFGDPGAADSDGAGPTAGPDGAPPFPGQDFIDPGVVLTSYSAVISVEPDPDNDPAPFDLKPLSAEIEDVGAATLQTMTAASSGDLPGGTVSIE